VTGAAEVSVSEGLTMAVLPGIFHGNFPEEGAGPLSRKENRMNRRQQRKRRMDEVGRV